MHIIDYIFVKGPSTECVYYPNFLGIFVVKLPTSLKTGQASKICKICKATSTYENTSLK